MTADTIGRFHEEGWKAHEARDALWVDPTNEEKKRKLHRHLADFGKPSDLRVLDYGCGNGILTQWFRDQGYRATGLDVSPTVIGANRKRYPDVTFALGKVDAPAPLRDASFDVVFCSEVIEHVYEVQAIFADFARLLRPGGRLVLTTPYHGPIKNLVVGLFFFDRHFDPTWQHIRFWSRKSLTAIAKRHGLRPRAWDHVGRFWPVPKSFFAVFEKVPA